MTKLQADYEAAKAAIAERDETLKAREDELAEKVQQLDKLHNKEFNFKRLRDMTEEEKERLTDVEQDLKRKQEALEDDQKAFKSTTLNTWKSDALDRASGGNAELRKQIESAYDDFKGDAEDRSAIAERVAKAARLVQAPPSLNPVTAAVGATGDAPTGTKKAFSETDEGKSLATSLGLGISKEQTK